ATGSGDVFSWRFLMDVCEEVADIAHVEISGIVRVLGTRSKPRVRSRTDGLAKSGQFSTDKKMPKSLSATERPLLARDEHSKHRLCLVRGLRDRNDLELLTGCADHIPNSFAHQRPCDGGNEGNGTGLGVCFVLSHDMIFL